MEESKIKSTDFATQQLLKVISEQRETSMSTGYSSAAPNYLPYVIVGGVGIAAIFMISLMVFILVQ